MCKLEIFFDYACPYCYRAHAYITELAPLCPGIEIVWNPCEAHPRPERYGLHSDLCIRGMFFARDSGADLWAYHALMYRAIHEDRVNVEDVGALSAVVAGLLDAGAFRAALQGGIYKNGLQRANDYAYEESGVWVVPAYRMGGRKIDPAEDVGVTKKQLKRFIEWSPK